MEHTNGGAGGRRPRTSHRRATGSGPSLAPTVVEAAIPAATTPTAAADAPRAEILEDRRTDLGASRHAGAGPRRIRRVGLSAGGAIVGTFLLAALALGAAIGPLGLTSGEWGRDGGQHAGPEPAASRPPSEPTGPTAAATHGDSSSGDGTAAATDPPTGDGTGQPDGAGTGNGGAGGADATPEPTAAEPTEAPAPAVATIEIGVGIDNVYPVVEWSHCSTDGFLAFKVIRSKDSSATWPLGSGDTLAATFTSSAAGRFVDRSVGAGRTVSYRVVALRSWNGAPVVACRSGVKGVTTPPPSEPTTAPATGPGLTVGLNDAGHPVIDWTACSGVDFSYYKVVRSIDSTVAWPLGAGDTLAAVVAAGGETIATDGDAPAGAALWYRVFCVRSSDTGYAVVAASDIRSVTTPAAVPPPDPVSLSLEAHATAEGVALAWGPCTSDAFHWYKVVRSPTNSNPSYLPPTNGTTLIGVIESAATTSFVDTSAPSGATAWYRVQCLGSWNGQVVLLGQTAAIAVAVP